MSHRQANPSSEQFAPSPEKCNPSDDITTQSRERFLTDCRNSTNILQPTQELGSSGNPDVNAMLKGFSVGGESSTPGCDSDFDPMDTNHQAPIESDSKTNKYDTGYGGGSKGAVEGDVRGEKVQPNDPHAKNAEQLRPSDAVKNDPLDKLDPGQLEGLKKGPVKEGQKIEFGQKVDPNSPEAKNAQRLNKSDAVQKGPAREIDGVQRGEKVDPGKAKNVHRLKPSDAIKDTKER